MKLNEILTIAMMTGVLSIQNRAHANDFSSDDCISNAKKAALEIVKINRDHQGVQDPYVSSVWSPRDFFYDVFVVTDLGGESYAHDTVKVDTSLYCAIKKITVN